MAREGRSLEITENAMLGGRIRLLQPAGGYRAGIDPVFLAGAAPLAAGGRALDLGCGVGTAALCLARRQAEVAILGLELQPELADLAERNVALNELGLRIAIRCGDLLRPPAEIAVGGFDVVLANPPFHPADEITAPAEATRAAGHVEGEADLAAWIQRSLALAGPKGTLLFIHRPDRLEEILGQLGGKAGGIVVFPLWPMAGRPARRVLILARKGSAAPLTLAAGLVLHEADGSYSAAAEAVLRDGAALEL
jgi:tRNA1(Val) A37 N6-methylase TrmN6